MHDEKSGGFSRREVLRTGAVGTVALSSVGWLAGCLGGDDGDTTTSAAGGGKPVRGGELVVAMITGGQKEVIGVRRGSNQMDTMRNKQIWEPLFRIDDKGVPAPWLVEQYEVTPDAKRWTFKLRKDVTWHDGKPFTADDVLYTVNSWRAKDAYFHAIADANIDFSGVRKRDSHTIDFALKRGVAEFPSLLGFYSALIIQDGSKDEDKPVGTGPFKFESFDPGKRSVFVANRDYWKDETPYVDRLVVDTSFTDETARVNALLSGSAHIVPGMPFAIAKANAERAQIRIGNSPGPGFQALTCIVKQPPFRDDPRVALALKLCMNREAMVNEVFSGYATVSNDCIGKTVPYHAEDFKRERDVEQAKSLLKAAGYSDLRLELVTGNVVPGFVEAATLFVRQAAEAGVTIKLKQIDPAIYYTDAGGRFVRPFANNYWSSVISLSNIYLQALHSDCPYPESGWGDPKSDALLFDAVAETDKAKAADKWHAVQELQFERGGYIVYGNTNFVDGYGPTVKGIDSTPAGWADNHNYRIAWIES